MIVDIALKSAAAGAVALAFGGAPLGVLLIARRMSLLGDALSHGILLGAALAYVIAGPDVLMLTLGALAAGLVLAGLSSLLARTGKLPEDASVAVLYLPALAAGALLMGHKDVEVLHQMLFGESGVLTPSSVKLSATTVSITLVAMALFLRGFLAESADPLFTRSMGVRGTALHILLMMLVALNLVAGFRAFGALMTVGLMMIPAAAARFWGRGYGAQAGTAVILSTVSSLSGLVIANRLDVEPGAVMALVALGLFLLSGIFGPVGGLLQNLPGRAHLEA